MRHQNGKPTPSYKNQRALDDRGVVMAVKTTTGRSALPKLPTVAKPVEIPMRTSKPCLIPLASHSRFSSTIASFISNAIQTQAAASSATPLVSGSPKKTSTASPINLSRVPPCFDTTWAIPLR